MKVPRYNQQVTSLNVPNVASPNIPIPPAAAFGEIQQARDIKDLGATIGKISGMVTNQMAQHQERAYDQQLASNFQSASTELHNSMFSNDTVKIKQGDQEVDAPSGYVNRQLSQAHGISQDFNMTGFNIAEKYRSSFKDIRYQQKFDEMFGREFQVRRDIVNKHEASELQKNNDMIFENSQANMLQDAASIQSPEQAQLSIKNMADLIAAHGKSNGWAPEIIQAKTREANASLLSKAAVESLYADPTGELGKKIVDSVVSANGDDSGGITQAQYQDVSKKLFKAKKEYSKELTANQEALQDKNFADIALSASGGKRISSEDLGSLLASGGLRKDQSDAIESGFSNLPDKSISNALSNSLDAILDIKDSKQQTQSLINLMQDKGLDANDKSFVVGFMMNHGADRMVQDFGKNLKFTTKSMGLDSDRVSKDYMANVSNKMTPQVAADTAIQTELLRQSGNSQKEVNLLGFSFDLTRVNRGNTSMANSEPVAVPQNLGGNVFQYLVKSGIAKENAAVIAQTVVKESSGAKTSLELAQKFQDSLDKNVPQWGLTPEGQQAKAELQSLVKINGRGILGVIQSWGQKFGRGTVNLGTIPDSLLQVNLHKEIEAKSAELEKLGVVFGREIKDRTPEKQAKIDALNKDIVGLWRQMDISKDAQKWWNGIAESRVLDTQDQFYKDSSWVKFVGKSMESAPLLSLSVAVGAVYAPAGIAVFTVPAGAEKYNRAMDEGKTDAEASNIAMGDIVANSLAFHFVPKIFDGVPGAAVALTKNGIAQRSIEIAGKAAEGAAVMGASNTITNAVNILGFDDAISLTQGLGEAMLTGAITVGAIGSFLPSRAKEIAKMKKDAEAKGVDVPALSNEVAQKILDPETAGQVSDQVYNDVVSKFPQVKTTLDVLKKNQEEGKLNAENLRANLVKQVNPDEPVGGQPAVIAPKEPVDPEAGVPLFKNTEEALQFGKGADAKTVASLESAKKQSQEKYDRLMAEGKESEALALASGQKQFVNEALKAAQTPAVDSLGRAKVSNRPAKEQPVFSEADKAQYDTISQISDQWQGGGELIRYGDGKVVGRTPSTFPEELKNIGMEQKVIRPTLQNIKEGKPLTEKQKQVAQLLKEWHDGQGKPGSADTKGLSESEAADAVRKGNQDEPLSKEDQSWGEEDVVAPVSEPSKASVEPAGLSPVSDFGNTGKMEKRGLAVSAEEKAVADGLVTAFKDVPEYEKTDFSKQATDILSFVKSDPQRGFRVAMRQEAAPAGLIPEMVWIAMDKQATLAGDTAMVSALGTKSGLIAESTSMAKRLASLGQLDPYSASKAIKEIVADKPKVSKEEMIKQTKDLKKIVKEEIKKAEKIKDWEDFIKGLEC